MAEGEFKSELEKQVRRKVKSREQGPWRELATFGMVGWSVALPTVLGIALGSWIDRRWPSDNSWTLMLLSLGIMIGCANAWWWIQQNR